MNKNEGKIVEVISSAAVISPDEINSDDDLAVLGIDSLTKTQLMISLEDTLDIRFDDSDLDSSRLTKVSDIINLAKKYLS